MSRRRRWPVTVAQWNKLKKARKHFGRQTDMNKHRGQEDLMIPIQSE
jgi:hypothetical protein